MLRSTVLAPFALLICSNALAVTLVPISFTSTSQTVQVFDTGVTNFVPAVTATDPTDAVATFSFSAPLSGTDTSEAKVAAECFSCPIKAQEPEGHQISQWAQTPSARIFSILLCPTLDRRERQ